MTLVVLLILVFVELLALVFVELMAVLVGQFQQWVMQLVVASSEVMCWICDKLLFELLDVATG